jgi:signal transduction histidine kinase
VRFGIKAKQVAGVTVLVGLAVIILSAWYLSELARVHLEQTQAQAKIVADSISTRVDDVIRSGADPYVGLRTDPGLQSILHASLILRSVTYVAIVNPDDVIIVIASGDQTRAVGERLAPTGSLATLLEQGRMAQWRAISTAGEYEFSNGLVLVSSDGKTTNLGSIRLGVSTLLIKDQLERSLKTPLYTAFVVLIVASIVAMLLAQIVLRPIHVIRSGLARLGRGERNVNVDLPPEGELAGLGDSFKAVSARLEADRTQLAGQKATLESVVDHLEDAVALFAPDGALLFANPAMRNILQSDANSLDQLLPTGHPYRAPVDETIAKRQSQGPVHVWVPGAGERLILTHMVEDADRRWLGIMLVVRNLAYLSEVESTLSYSRKLAALGRLSAGIAHEVKNPLNATMIHLELLKMQVQDTPAAKEHLRVIAAQVRRLDEVVQGFLKFTRPEDLKLEPTAIGPLIEDLIPVIQAEAEKSGVNVRLDCPPTVPRVSADPVMLQQAFLNLALNACQAMPHGGRLRIAATVSRGRRVEVAFEDTGVGIPPEHLERIFDLYFTTKEQGTGIGLSMVYRTVQLHDGEIEVQSVPGTGTTFRVLLRQA